ncbi:MAG: hypothetical protein RMX96_11570 [Nostoc sp. ChiSLP02]|nr:hypothetical protein [Nostoc sp. DedSLP05]MDZ8099103.1 hypothetical protein [Nostoc sp. DedSLP01]MDZ8185480.1 hypothetical protein [Nostoc sp. ChiSLP02]
MALKINQLFNSVKYLPAIIGLITISSLPVKAATFLASDRATFGGNDELNWVSLGKVFNPAAPDFSAFLGNSFSATSQGSLGLNVNIASTNNSFITPPFVFQTLPRPGIPTNFANGDYVLFGGIDQRAFGPNPSFPAPGNGGPLTITFDRPVFGAGTQIAVDDRPTFDIFVSAYDSANNLLNTFSTKGTSSLLLDNSALFVGVRSDEANISRLVFSTSFPQQGLAINKISIIGVPEPTYTLAILVFGISSVVLKVRQRI